MYVWKIKSKLVVHVVGLSKDWVNIFNHLQKILNVG